MWHAHAETCEHFNIIYPPNSHACFISRPISFSLISSPKQTWWRGQIVKFPHYNFLQSPVTGFLSGPNKPVFEECKTDSQTKRQIQYDTDVTILPIQTSESKDTLSGFVQSSPTPWAGCLRHDCSRHGTKCEGLKGLPSYRTSVHTATPLHTTQPGDC